VLNKFKAIAFLFILGISSTHAIDCEPVVAKIYQVNKTDQVLILREGKKKELAHRQNNELCAGNKVIVPKTLSLLKVEYYSYPPKTVRLKAGDLYQVKALAEPCGMLCKFKENIKTLAYKLIHEEPVQLISTILGDRGVGKDIPIFMILASTQGQEEPFYLFSDQGTIPLFWTGKQPPYKLVVKNRQGKKVIQETVNTNTFSLTLPNTTSNQSYTLQISSESGGDTYQKTLVFAVPPFPLSPKVKPYETFATLLAMECNENTQNWRLEIWRQLHHLPNSSKKERFMGHLAGDDFDLSEVGLCE
jgi:hypothetical protein